MNDPYPRFQGHAIFFDAEYLSFNEILIGTYTRPTNSVISNDLE